jgi:hypothetical protein
VSESATPFEYAVSKDGFAFDPETGEIFGMVDHAGKLIEETDEKPRFVVDTLDKAEWVLEKMMSAESDIVALKAKLAAITDNITSQVKTQEAKLGYLHGRFGADLKQLASEQLEGKKQRSIKTAYGTLAFRTTQGSIKVTDMVAAVDWCKSFCPDALKVTESVLVTPLNGSENDLPTYAFEVTAPGETFSIKTGVRT